MEAHMCRRFAFRARFIGFLALAIMGVTNRALKSAAIETTTAKADFYVAPGGKDTDPGTLEKPFATLARVRDAVRKNIAAGLDCKRARIDPGRHLSTDRNAGLRAGRLRHGQTLYHVCGVSGRDGPAQRRAADYRLEERRGRNLDGGDPRGEGGRVVLPATIRQRPASFPRTNAET